MFNKNNLRPFLISSAIAVLVVQLVPSALYILLTYGKEVSPWIRFTIPPIFGGFSVFTVMWLAYRYRVIDSQARRR